MNLAAIGSLHQGEIVLDQPELMTFTQSFWVEDASCEQWVLYARQFRVKPWFSDQEVL